VLPRLNLGIKSSEARGMLVHEGYFQGGRDFLLPVPGVELSQTKRTRHAWCDL